jgi:hypothetical protein
MQKRQTEKRKHSITHYLMKGPEAVERRLAKLEEDLKVWEGRIKHLTSVSFHLTRKFGPTKLIPRATSAMRDLATRTVQELRSERDALKALVGEHLRPWETKKSGPAPI